jgi:hypothetical protein
MKTNQILTYPLIVSIAVASVVEINHPVVFTIWSTPRIEVTQPAENWANVHVPEERTTLDSTTTVIAPFSGTNSFSRTPLSCDMGYGQFSL